MAEDLFTLLDRDEHPLSPLVNGSDLFLLLDRALGKDVRSNGFIPDVHTPQEVGEGPPMLPPILKVAKCLSFDSVPFGCARRNGRDGPQETLEQHGAEHVSAVTRQLRMKPTVLRTGR
jgi:hypothetical protein